VKVVEVFKPQIGDEGGPRFNFLSAERKEREKFKLAVEMGGLAENLPDTAEIADSEAFTGGEKGVVNVEIEGLVAPQNTLNVEIFDAFEPVAKFMSIPVVHEIGAAGEVESVRKYSVYQITFENVPWTPQNT
jgi:hypothetical protein